MTIADIELIHSAEYGSILKASQRFVSKNCITPALTMALHRADGAIIACDRHRAIIVKSAHGFTEDVLINPFTFEAAKGNYPDVSKIAEIVGQCTVTLENTQISVWLQLHKSLNQLNKTFGNRSNIGELMFGENSLKVLVGENDETKVRIELPRLEYKQPKDTKRISYNVEYMRDALQVHKDFGSKELKISVGSPFQPIHLDDDSDRMKVLVLPYRRE